MVILFLTLSILALTFYFIKSETSAKKEKILAQESIVCLFACAMLIDHRKTKEELLIVRKFLIKNFDKNTTTQMLFKLKEHINNPQFNRSDVRPYCIGVNLGLKYQQRINLLTTLFRICSVNGEINEYEDELIQKYANHSNIREDDYEKIRNLFSNAYRWKKKRDSEKRSEGATQSYFAKNTSWARKTLGISENADETEIKRAYRLAAREYHPDKHLDASESEIHHFTKKFLEINEAYDILIK